MTLHPKLGFFFVSGATRQIFPRLGSELYIAMPDTRNLQTQLDVQAQHQMQNVPQIGNGSQSTGFPAKDGFGTAGKRWKRAGCFHTKSPGVRFRCCCNDQLPPSYVGLAFTRLTISVGVGGADFFSGCTYKDT
jgi:hypothetical protein